MNFPESKLPGLVKNLLRIAEEKNASVQELVDAVLEDRMDDAKNLARTLNHSSSREASASDNCVAEVR